MQYSDKQVKYILNKASRNTKHAIMRDGRVFINDITLASGLEYSSVKMLFRGYPIDLTGSEKNAKKASKIFYQASSINNRRENIRNIFQRISDKLTRNYKLETLSDREIDAWFALDKLCKESKRVKINRVGYMYKIRLGNIELSHLPSEKCSGMFFVTIEDRTAYIEKDKSNGHLYDRAKNTFYKIYDGYMKQK